MKSNKNRSTIKGTKGPKVKATNAIENNRKSLYQNAKVTLKRASIILSDRIPMAFWIFCFFSFGLIGFATYFIYFRQKLTNLDKSGADFTDLNKAEEFK